jgi:hypothetical protein
VTAVAIIAVFIVLLIVTAVAHSWIDQRRAVDNFRDIERRRLP